MPRSMTEAGDGLENVGGMRWHPDWTRDKPDPPEGATDQEGYSDLAFANADNEDDSLFEAARVITRAPTQAAREIPIHDEPIHVPTTWTVLAHASLAGDEQAAQTLAELVLEGTRI